MGLTGQEHDRLLRETVISTEALQRTSLSKGENLDPSQDFYLTFVIEKVSSDQLLG